MGGDIEVDRLVRREIDIDAAFLELAQRAAHRLALVQPLPPGHQLAPDIAARGVAPAALDMQPRHLQHFERGDELVGIDLRRLLQFVDVALGQAPQPLGQQAQLELLAQAIARHAVGGPRRVERPRPVEVAGPARDRGAADAGARRNLVIGEGGLLDKFAHRRHGGVAMRAARRLAFPLALRIARARQDGDGVRVRRGVGLCGGVLAEGDDVHS